MKLKSNTEQGCFDVRLCIDRLGLSDEQKKILGSLSDKQMKEMVRVLNEEKKKEEEEQSKKTEKIKKRIFELLNESRKYIYAEKWMEREGYFNKENKESVRLDTLECVLKIFKSLENGISLEDIIKELDGKYRYFVYVSGYAPLFSKYEEKWRKAVKKRERKRRISEFLEFLGEGLK